MMNNGTRLQHMEGNRIKPSQEQPGYTSPTYGIPVTIADEYYERWNDCNNKLEAANAEVARLKHLLAEAREWDWITYDESSTDERECVQDLVKLDDAIRNALADASKG